MTEQIITRETRVSEALAHVPTALDLFRRYGVDPTISCGLMVHGLRLAEAETICALRQVDALIDDLNAARRA
jgi:hypothetical protein